MNSKTVFVPKTFRFEYVNANNETVQARLMNTIEYEFELRNEDGSISTTLATICGIYKDKETNKTFLRVGVEIYPGFMDVFQKSSKEIDIDTIQNVTPIHCYFIKDRERSYKKGNITDTEDIPSFRFNFDIPDFSSPYRTTIYKGEFVSIAASEPNTDKRRTYYGSIVDTTADNNVIFDHYYIYKGVHSIRHISIKAENILGIFRVKLEKGEYKKPEKRESKKSQEDTEITEETKEE